MSATVRREQTILQHTVGSQEFQQLSRVRNRGAAEGILQARHRNKVLGGEGYLRGDRVQVELPRERIQTGKEVALCGRISGRSGNFQMWK